MSTETPVATRSSVTQVEAASSDAALRHFADLLAFETDCWDVHEALSNARADFVLLDVRSPEMFAKGHVDGALSMPHGKITRSKFEAYPPETLFVTYCAGPHCNGAQKGAIKLAQIGRPVKLMIGGVTGWIDEGFDLVAS